MEAIKAEAAQIATWDKEIAGLQQERLDIAKSQAPVPQESFQLLFNAPRPVLYPLAVGVADNVLGPSGFEDSDFVFN